MSRNPLYEVWRTKKYTPRDALLHFLILDVASMVGANGFTMSDFAQEADERCKKVLDEAYSPSPICSEIIAPKTIRDKLDEYEALGLLASRHDGREKIYSLSPLTWSDLPEGLSSALNFFSEIAPFGEVGDHISEDSGITNESFRFKHHFIVHTLEDEALFDLLSAIKEQRRVKLHMDREPKCITGVPLQILVSVQSGRRYIAIMENADDGAFRARRLDYVNAVEVLDASPNYDDILGKFNSVILGVWGVSFGINRDINAYDPDKKTEKVEIKLRIDESREKFVLARLRREGRRGIIERVCENVYVFRCEVWDSNEMLPFVMSFIGRIISFKCDNEETITRFQSELNSMMKMYAPTGRDTE
jgi:PAS domain-containing protein